MLVFHSAFTRRQDLAKILKKYNAIQLVAEGPYFVCKIHDSQIASKLRSLPEIKSTAIAKQVPRRFSNIIRAITEAGIDAIMPGEKFYVKVFHAVKGDYVERDIEFASTGALVEKMAKANALPARNDHEADCVILAIVGKKQAYIFVKDKN